MLLVRLVCTLTVSTGEDSIRYFGISLVQLACTPTGSGPGGIYRWRALQLDSPVGIFSGCFGESILPMLPGGYSTG